MDYGVPNGKAVRLTASVISLHPSFHCIILACRPLPASVCMSLCMPMLSVAFRVFLDVSCKTSAVRRVLCRMGRLWLMPGHAILRRKRRQDRGLQQLSRQEQEEQRQAYSTRSAGVPDGKPNQERRVGYAYLLPRICPLFEQPTHALQCACSCLRCCCRCMMIDKAR